MKNVFLVAVGGGIGAVSRYLLGAWASARSGDLKFPVGTFFVNVLGCLIAGVLAGWMERRHVFNIDARLFLFVGVLGGFTTFSAFGLETVSLWRRGELPIAASYAVLSVSCGVAALWLGVKAAS